MKKQTTLLQFRNLSLRAKLLISMLLVTGLSMAILALVAYNRTQNSQTVLVNTLQETVRQQSETQLNQILSSEVTNADESLAVVTNAVQGMANYRSSLYARQELFSKGDYWDAATRLVQQTAGQYGNPASDIASVFVPNTTPLTEFLTAEINASVYLDFSAPAVLEANPNVVAVYFIGKYNYTIYYPNIDLANNVPPDFDAVSQTFYTIVTPKNDPERKSLWTPPYQDPAGTGLIVTGATPVYDQNNIFRGVLAADVQLARISEQISAIKVGKTGFAFLVDTEGRIISMPEAGYSIFGIQPETVPVNETPKVTILGQGPEEIQTVTSRMVTGEQGLTAVDIQGAPYYMAYAPLPTIGYSLGILVPQAEMDEPFLAARDRIESETRNTVRLSAMILIALMIFAAGVSFFISQITATPLIELTSAARQIASGDLNVRARSDTTDEIGVLARTFNEMAAQLQGAFSTLEQRVADRTKALRTSADVTRRLTSVTSLRQLAVEVVEQVKSAFNYYHAHIYFLDEDSGDLVMTGGTGEAGATMLARSHKIQKGRGLVGRAAETNAPILVPDVSQAEGWLPNPLLPETRSEVAVPISSGDQVLGVLDVQQNMVNGLGEEDVELLQSIAGQVAISLKNIRSFEESRAQAELEAMANLISQKIQRAASVEETLQTAIRELSTVLGASRAKATINLTPQGDAKSASDS